MTREEAISNLRGLVSSYPLKHDEWQAIEMAIEALKREQKALELKPLVRNISGWNEVVNEISKLSSGSDNRPKIHGCSFASEECAKNPCADCGVMEGEAE